MQRTVFQAGFRAGFVLLVSSGLMVAGCASQEQSAGLGALIGGAAGAVIGNRTGNPWIGAAVGTALGAAAGYVVHEYSRQSRSAQQTARDYGYSPGQGFAMNLKDVAVTPRAVRPGQRVSSSFEYAVLGSGQEGVSVNESCLLKQNDQVLNVLSEKSVPRTDGTWAGVLEFEVPPGAAPGRYTLARQVSANGVTRYGQTDFTVRGSAGLSGESALAMTE